METEFKAGVFSGIQRYHPPKHRHTDGCELCNKSIAVSFELKAGGEGAWVDGPPGRGCVQYNPTPFTWEQSGDKVTLYSIDSSDYFREKGNGYNWVFTVGDGKLVRDEDGVEFRRS
mmetsp:Transcript_3181/g.5188  ORF Transcript_3181/g.5188 Transcript_3181/m.5188 type:complete len:116 (+) Transcript_3181:71-418(+)|eukprot:CAMPEP_0169267076 /NCGR_PEP_ID=MMETSP1016-20121227/46851_1 /TAXON_ID=342587 /ORGANISM="Karlodinium micrum, Strain CCMP2283" /LENGTH=115 /DNA_ID=CAMNT_0009351251 /DNA_START=7 /DNA_END=354 /DNA_ORIENTATION=-